MSDKNQTPENETARKALDAEADSVIRQLRESQSIAETYEDEENASESRRAADLIEKLMAFQTPECAITAERDGLKAALIEMRYGHTDKAERMAAEILKSERLNLGNRSSAVAANTENL